MCNNRDMKKRIIIYLNAPITIAFVCVCSIALLLQTLTNGYSTDLLFSTYSSSLLNPFTYIRLFGHVFGHADFSHLISNVMYILILGPMLEEKYHDKLIYVILTTAIVTGIINNIFFPGTHLLGASGVVFAFILLSSVTGSNRGVPITAIIVALLWIGGEIYDMVTLKDNISHITHIIGGITGLIIGLQFKRQN